MCKGSAFTLEITLYSPIFLIFSLISAKCAPLHPDYDELATTYIE